MEKIIKRIAESLDIKEKQVRATVDLIDQGNTIPFISRYRKEVTGGLTDDILRKLDKKLTYLRNLKERKEDVIRLIDEQDKLTEELEKAILEAETVTEVDDLYRPYKKKRRTRATKAKEKGLEPLAQIIFEQEKDNIEEIAKEYIDEEKEVETVEEAIQGALDIIAEYISDNAEYRKFIREDTYYGGVIHSYKKKDAEDEHGVFEMYYDHKEAINKIPGHRILAMNRGENEDVLTVKVIAPEEMILHKLQKEVLKGDSKYVKEAINDSYKRLIEPSIEREIRNMLDEKAEEGAMRVFKSNLEQLLLQAPIKDKVVLGLDPAYRTGCKLAVVGETGKVLDHSVIYPTPPQSKVKEAKERVLEYIKKYDIDLIAIGNGTASRESEEFIANLLDEVDKKIYYVIVNEAGASVYSASKLASEEFPEFDVGTRSAASIARRLQDPLAELVKIDPKAIGVGQYQHDMNQTNLSETLRGVVEDCVNSVGVDLNTASSSLLQYISGVSKRVANNIIKFREEKGKFKTRKQLKEVRSLGPKTFLQCAGFLRISDAENILDNTAVHPESYKATRKLLDNFEMNLEDVKNHKISKNEFSNIKELADKIDIGLMTLKDIIDELVKPGRDKREEMPKPILKSDVLTMEDLKKGMVLKGTVRNIVDFGAFVDIGVHQDGLVHISKIAKKFIKHPLEVVSVGDIVQVQVIDVDLNKNRISLSMVDINGK